VGARGRRLGRDRVDCYLVCSQPRLSVIAWKVDMGLFGFFFGESNRDKKARDSWLPTVIAKNLISPINEYGTCFGCGGAGKRTLACRSCGGLGVHTGVCRACRGSGRFERPAQPCFGCEGTGQKIGSECRRCNGSGNFKPAISEACRKCNGTGSYSATCHKCNGAREFIVTCRKCGGSGWHKRRR
jgi:DnaJ-class molecular chaperone